MQINIDWWTLVVGFIGKENLISFFVGSGAVIATIIFIIIKRRRKKMDKDIQKKAYEARRREVLKEWEQIGADEVNAIENVQKSFSERKTQITKEFQQLEEELKKIN